MLAKNFVIMEEASLHKSSLSTANAHVQGMLSEVSVSTRNRVNEIEEHINDLENMNKKDDEIMCFYCRNSIKLNSFEEPFGKLGLNIEDFFYINSIKATLRDEFSKLILNKEDNYTYSEILKTIHGQKFFRIISCGHYFPFTTSGERRSPFLGPTCC